MRIKLENLNDEAITKLYGLIIEKVLTNPAYSTDPYFKLSVLEQLEEILDDMEADDEFGTEGLFHMIGFD